ncbi:hypothetical protein C6Y45_12155 [Alkalicoccus saliphilus]|uniref:Uncharacterized protein n=1 Tax=Alkalicoccus saliphilus TaxID=200989 RepID=A0A2T4U4E2_9BACI|nr:hypothetical protein C6Y45_12155 [Alkalicoccus saliphilus]
MIIWKKGDAEDTANRRHCEKAGRMMKENLVSSKRFILKGVVWQVSFLNKNKQSGASGKYSWCAQFFYDCLIPIHSKPERCLL